MIATENQQDPIFKGFQPDSKVWIYSSDRLLTDNEAEEINQLLVNYTQQWTSHDEALKSAGTVLNNRFIVLAVDESVASSGGCSIDKSIHFIKEIGTRYELNLFDRLTVYYQSGEEMKSFHLNVIKDKFDNGELSENSIIYDTTITQLGALQTQFVKKAGDSWLARFIK